MLEVGRHHTVEITDTSNLGFGVCRIEGAVVFVCGALCGDVCEIALTGRSHGVWQAESVRVITASPYRTETVCPAFPRCGGCDLEHADYAHELALKQRYVARAFDKAGLNVPVEEVRTDGRTSGYRNKAVMPFGRTDAGCTLGYYRRGSYDVVPAAHCALLPPVFRAVAAAAETFFTARKTPVYDRKTGTGLLRHLYLRIGEGTGEMMVCLVLAHADTALTDAFASFVTAQFPEVVSVLVNIHRAPTNLALGPVFSCVAGRETIEDVLCGLRFRISPAAFYQVNHDCAELLYREVQRAAALSPGMRAADLYCGTGTIGILLANACPQAEIMGVELSAEAVDDARVNQRQNGADNLTFFCTDAAAAPLGNLDVVVLDPPRRGCSPDMIQNLLRVSPARIIYVSCNPDTLARDCAALVRGGYAVERAAPFNMFPRTAHVETVALLSRRKPDDVTGGEIASDE